MTLIKSVAGAISLRSRPCDPRPARAPADTMMRAAATRGPSLWPQPARHPVIARAGETRSETPALSSTAASRLMMAVGFGPDALLELFRALPHHDRHAAGAWLATHGDVNSRRAVIPLLACRDGAPQALSCFVHDPAPVVRYALVHALRHAPDKSLLAVMQHDADPWVRQAVARACMMQNAGASDVAIRMAKEDKSVMVRRALADALTDATAPRKDAVLRILSRDPSARVRAATYVACGNDKTAVALLQERVAAEPSPWARHGALRELAKRDGLAAARWYSSMAMSLPSNVSMAMARMLLRLAPQTSWLVPWAGEGEQNKPERLWEMQDALYTPTAGHGERLHAMRVLAAHLSDPRLDPEWVMSITEDLVLHSSTDQAALCSGLQRMIATASPEFIFALDKLRRNVHREVYARATVLLYLWKAPEAIPMLHDMLDAGPGQQEEAAFGLGQLAGRQDGQPTGHDALADAMLRLAADRSSSVRSLAPVLAERVGSPQAREILDVCLHDPSVDVRLAAFWPAARGARFDSRALAALAHDPDPRLRLNLAKICKDAPTEQALPALAALAHDTDRDVIYAVAQSLANHPTARGLHLLTQVAEASDGLLRSDIDWLRSRMLLAAWEQHGETLPVAAMLRGWETNLADIDPMAVRDLARSAVPGRLLVVRGLTQSPYQRVREKAHAGLAAEYEASYKRASATKLDA